MAVSFDIDPNKGVANSEANRASRIQSITGELANDEAAREMESRLRFQSEVANSYSQDPSGGQNLTTGQTQVQAVPVSPNPAPTPGPLSMQVPQMPAEALAQPGSSPNPTPPPATAFQGAPAAPQAAARPQGAPKASPWDSPQYQKALAVHLAGQPNGAVALQQIKRDRDAVIGKVMETIGNGHTDEARYMAQQYGLDIPEKIYQNSDLAMNISLMKAAYPEEADKGQVGLQAMMATQGDLSSRLQAAMASAGPPTNAGQRALNQAIALANFNQSKPTPFNTTNGLVMLNPQAGTARPVTYQGTNTPVTGVTGGAGLGRNGSMSGGVFGYKVNQYLASHPGDEDGALRFASGQMTVPGEVPTGAQSTDSGPIVGTVVDGYQYMGGDVNSEASWMSVGGQ